MCSRLIFIHFFSHDSVETHYEVQSYDHSLYVIPDDYTYDLLWYQFCFKVYQSLLIDSINAEEFNKHVSNICKVKFVKFPNINMVPLRMY